METGCSEQLFPCSDDTQETKFLKKRALINVFIERENKINKISTRLTLIFEESSLTAQTVWHRMA